MGGIPTADGKVIKCGKLFRTAYISPKTELDNAYLEQIGLDTVIDFRSAGEIAERPDCLPNGVKYINAPVFTSAETNALAPTKKMVRRLLFSSDKTIANLQTEIENSYVYMPFRTGAYSQLFNCLDKGETVAFHCTAGKDRTGIGAILIMLALGCSIQTCLSEYLLSNEYQQKKIDAMNAKLKFVPTSKTVKNFCVTVSQTHQNLFDIALNSIFSKYSTITSFFENEYGINQQKIDLWKSFYLE